jgi:glutathione synthase/RimK-type ligase-like ATP-grasp enzyme
MQKIGILFGQERSFPEALIQRINQLSQDQVLAEPVRIDKVIQGEGTGYAVILDRISHEVPFYRAYLKNAALTGTAVINNPFWVSADEKFFNNCLATRIGVPVPKTVILPSRDLPPDTSNDSFTNLAYPLDWDGIFDYVGFPAYMKPFAGGGWKNVYRLGNRDEFFHSHQETKQLVMMLQEEIVFEEYYRCYCVGAKYVRVMPYEPRNPAHLRYQSDFQPTPERLRQMEEIVLRLNRYLGYDFNTVELAVRGGVPYAIDFCNPAPDADARSVGPENFEWVVEAVARYSIERALSRREGLDNLTWGEYLARGVKGLPLDQ